MRPTTLRPSLHTPAMLASDPLGFAAAGAHVVAIGEAARDDGGVVALKVGVLVPEDVALDTGHERQRVLEVALAPRARVTEDRDSHRLSDTLAIRKPATAKS